MSGASPLSPGQFFERSPDPCCVTERNGRLLAVNRAFSEVLGHPPTEPLARLWWELLCDQDQAKARAILEQLSMEDPCAVFKGRFPDAAGQIRWLDCACVLSAAEGRVYITARDITAEKRLEDRLTESEGRFRAVFDHSADGILIADRQTRRFLMANRAMSRALGFRQDEWAGLSLADIHAEGDLPVICEDFDRLARGEFRAPWDVPFKRKDGSIVHMSVSGFFLTINGRECLGGLCRNATERRRADAALRENSQFLEHVFSGTLVPIACLDRALRFIRVNVAYAALDEREPEFFPGKGHFDLYPNPENQAIFQRVVETGEPFHAHAKSFQYANHPERGASYWDWSLNPVVDADGAVVSLVLSLQDVTERIEAEAALSRKLLDQEIMASILHLSLDPLPLREILRRSLLLVLQRHGLGLAPKGCIFLTRCSSFHQNLHL